jgi:hypothetical protein
LLEEQWQVVKVVVFVFLLLPAARVEVLPEVTLLVKKPNTNQGHP